MTSLASSDWLRYDQANPACLLRYVPLTRAPLPRVVWQLWTADCRNVGAFSAVWTGGLMDAPQERLTRAWQRFMCFVGDLFLAATARFRAHAAATSLTRSP